MSTTRRSFLAMSAMMPFALKAFAASKSIPVGLELYSVRGELAKNLESTVTAVAKMGYQCVEFYGPYFQWTEAQTKQYRKLIDDLGIKCYSTHNDQSNFNPENINKARDMNLILGTKYVVMASAKVDPTVDGWKKLADTLNTAADAFAPSGLKPGYHNHQPEWVKMGDTFPLEILAKNTKPSVMMQLDVGTCLESGGDPVAWIKANRDVSIRFIAKTGRPIPPLVTRFCSEKGKLTGREFLPQRKASAGLNITWLNRREAVTPS